MLGGLRIYIVQERARVSIHATSVIPGRCEAASPESIATTGEVSHSGAKLHVLWLWIPGSRF
jgi:hypothetical protein